MSEGEGHYIYGVIADKQRRELGPIGIGGRGDVVYTLPYQNLAAIVSASPIVKYPVTRENSMAHAKVLERAFETHTILPVRFCTIADGEDTIVEKLLRIRYQELTDLLQGMEGKVELGVRARWTDLAGIFTEVAEESETIKGLKGALLRERNEQKKYAGSIKIGQLVQQALEEKKKKEARQLLDALRPLSLSCKENVLYGDMNLVNAAFLVAKEREQEFDHKMQELEQTYGERTKLKYVGPIAPYNFVEVVVNW